MIPLTEAELLRMREVQRTSGLPAHYVTCLESDYRQWIEAATKDWPRLTEWALEARRLLVTILEMPAVKRGDYDDGSPWIRMQINEVWIQAARRLIGEP